MLPRPPRKHGHPLPKGNCLLNTRPHLKKRRSGLSLAPPRPRLGTALLPCQALTPGLFDPGIQGFLFNLLQVYDLEACESNFIWRHKFFSPHKGCKHLKIKQFYISIMGSSLQGGGRRKRGRRRERRRKTTTTTTQQPLAISVARGPRQPVSARQRLISIPSGPPAPGMERAMEKILMYPEG